VSSVDGAVFPKQGAAESLAYFLQLRLSQIKTGSWLF
jgi:hypothetical protein